MATPEGYSAINVRPYEGYYHKTDSTFTYYRDPRTGVENPTISYESFQKAKEQIDREERACYPCKILKKHPIIVTITSILGIAIILGLGFYLKKIWR